MLRRVVFFLVALPIAILLVTLAVTNRHAVRLVLDPFRPADPVLSIVLPLYVYLLGTLLIGIIIGGIATWMAQARWRRTARRRTAESMRWQAEADRLTRERQAQAQVPPARQLVAASR